MTFTLDAVLAARRFDVSLSLAPGETVAVLGPGPIGLMALQLVKALGATRVILTGTRESRLTLGRKLGADPSSRVYQSTARSRSPTGIPAKRSVATPARYAESSRCSRASR